MLLMVILVGMGERMAERFLPIYLLAMGGSFIAIGILNGLTNLIAALYSWPGGYISHRLGTKKALLLFNCMSITGYLIVILIPLWQAVIAGAFFFLAWSAISLPATMDIVAKVLPKSKRTMGVSMHSLVRRIPMALGPLLGGIFIDSFGERSGVRLAFAAAILMALLSIVLQQRMIEEDRGEEGAQDHLDRNPLLAARYISPDLANLLVSDILIRFCEQIPYAFVVVWCMKTIAHPVDALHFGFLTVVEMSTAVLVYVPVAYFADRTGKKPFVTATFVFFTLFPLALMFSDSFMALVGAFIVRGLKEFGEPTRKALIMDLAPEGRKAATFGVYYLIRDSIVSLAAFGGAFIWRYDPRINLLTAIGFGLAGTIWFALKGRDVVPRSLQE